MHGLVSGKSQSEKQVSRSASASSAVGLKLYPAGHSQTSVPLTTFG